MVTEFLLENVVERDFRFHSREDLHGDSGGCEAVRTCR
jgi:hypothetical protein